MTVFQAKTPAGEDLQTLLATHTMQSVRCAVFGRIRPKAAHYKVVQ